MPTPLGNIFKNLANGVADYLNNEELKKQQEAAMRKQMQLEAYKEELIMQRQAQHDFAVETFKVKLAAENTAKQAEKAKEAGLSKTRTQLQSGQTAVDRNALREVAQYTGGGKMDVFGNLVGVDPEQQEMVAFLTPASKIKSYLQRAAVYPEYLQLAKNQVSQSYGLTNPEDVNKRLNLISKMSIEDLTRQTEFLRKGNLQKGYEMIDKAGQKVKGSIDWHKVDAAKQALWGNLEKQFSPTSDEPKITPINITTQTGGLEAPDFSTMDGSEFLQ